jgi:hypothetical protein
LLRARTQSIDVGLTQQTARERVHAVPEANHGLLETLDRKRLNQIIDDTQVQQRLDDLRIATCGDHNRLGPAAGAIAQRAQQPCTIGPGQCDIEQ